MPDEEESKNARRRAIRFLVYRDRSRNEITCYLRGKKFSTNVIEETLTFLENNKYVNDTSFAMQFGRSRIVNKKIGRLRLGRELEHKGIENKVINETLNSLYKEFDEEAIAVSCLKKKLKTFESSAGEGDRRRIANFLERKGFPSEIISQVVARLTPYASDNDWVPPSSAPNQNK